MRLSGKHILLIITGGIAAYKSLQLIRDIQKEGGTVQAILTSGATHFVTPLVVATLTGRAALTELFDLTQETEIGHIELSRSADLIVVAPATADFLAKMAHGLADDLASTTILATDTKILVAPAMNVRMWEAKATQRNLKVLNDDGVTIVGPDQGEMACGEFGFGRLVEPQNICTAIIEHFNQSHTGPLTGKYIVVTSGPTREPIDPVRFISNVSSGKQGTAIAQSLVALGAKVTFITGPATTPRPEGCTIVEVTTAVEMQSAVLSSLPADAGIFCAAVADWRMAVQPEDKLKKTADGQPPRLNMIENPDILAQVSQLPIGTRPSFVVGFAAETQNLIDHAKAKLARKKCDLLLANDVSPENQVFGSDTNHVFAITSSTIEDWQRLSKIEVAHKLSALIARELAQN